MTLRFDSLQQIASCLSGYDPESLPVAQARAFIERLVEPVRTVEWVALRAGLGRILAHDIISSMDVPASDNSAMDGYALRGAELPPESAPGLFAVVGDAYAGQPFTGTIGAGECVRIMTGAVMPPGLDTVVPQEFVRVETGGIAVPGGVVRIGDNRRLAGEDLARGEPALRARRRLRPADLGLLASLGQAEVPVFRRLRVAFFSTGDELRSLGQPLETGCVYDSNRYTLWGMLQRLEVDVLDLGVVRDDPAALAATFRQAAASADAVITSGGVSVGEADHTKQVMASLGDVLFWRIAMRPGRPMAIGRIGRGLGGGSSAGANTGRAGPANASGELLDDQRAPAILFGLPGNPVAVMVTFYAFVRDALLAMSGAAPEPLPLLQATSAAPIRKKAGRTEYQRGMLSRGPDGRPQVALTGAQGSGILRSMSQANALIVLHHDQGSVAAGDEVDVLPFEGLV